MLIPVHTLSHSGCEDLQTIEHLKYLNNFNSEKDKITKSKMLKTCILFMFSCFQNLYGTNYYIDWKKQKF